MTKHHVRPGLAGFIGLLAMIFAGSAAATTLEVTLPPPGDFVTTPIDNKYFPLLIGTSFAYVAETEDGCEFDKLTVLAATYAVALGYNTRVIREQAWEAEDCSGTNAELVEDTNDYYAQDSEGRVWYFGEETYALPDEGEGPACHTGGSWEAGVPGEAGEPAQPGIIMLAHPESGDRYSQELLVDEAEDWGAITQLHAKVSIDFADFPDCLKTREWSPLEPGSVEHKFYCPFEGENPGPGGLMFIEELHGKTLYVEYVGPDFSGIVAGLLPGEDDAALPSSALDCTP